MVIRVLCLLGILAVSASWPAAFGAEPAEAVPSKPPAAEPSADAGPMSFSRYRKLKLPVGPSLVAVVKEHTGRQVLAIHYPWKVHEKASIEVRLMPGKRAEGTSVVPVFFVAEHCKGELKQKLYRYLDAAADTGITDSFTKDKMVYQIVAERNSLGRPSLHVLPYNEGSTPDQRPGAVFLQLDCWAINDRMLSLDMPRDVFVKSGKLSVWFLRGDKVVWEEKIDWPGYE